MTIYILNQRNLKNPGNPGNEETAVKLLWFSRCWIRALARGEAGRRLRGLERKRRLRFCAFHGLATRRVVPDRDTTRITSTRHFAGNEKTTPDRRKGTQRNETKRNVEEASREWNDDGRGWRLRENEVVAKEYFNRREAEPGRGKRAGSSNSFPCFTSSILSLSFSLFLCVFLLPLGWNVVEGGGTEKPGWEK